MTINEIREYAKERGLPEKRTELLISELHPDNNGKLDTIEAMQAVNTINYIVATRENTRTLLEAVKRDRNQNNK